MSRVTEILAKMALEGQSPKNSVKPTIAKFSEDSDHPIISLTDWQDQAPDTWYHGSLLPNQTKIQPVVLNVQPHPAFIAAYGVYVTDSAEVARIFGVNIYQFLLPDKRLLVPDPDIQFSQKGLYVAAVYQGIIFPVTQIESGMRYGGRPHASA